MGAPCSHVRGKRGYFGRILLRYYVRLVVAPFHNEAVWDGPDYCCYLARLSLCLINHFVARIRGCHDKVVFSVIAVFPIFSSPPPTVRVTSGGGLLYGIPSSVAVASEAFILHANGGRGSRQFVGPMVQLTARGPV